MDKRYTEYKRNHIEAIIIFIIACFMIFFKEELITMLGVIIDSCIG